MPQNTNPDAAQKEFQHSSCYSSWHLGLAWEGRGASIKPVPVQLQYKQLGNFFFKTTSSCGKLNNKNRSFGLLQINQIRISFQVEVEYIFFHKLKECISLQTYISGCELLCGKSNDLGQLLNKMALQERRYSLWDVAKVKSQIVLNCLYRTYLYKHEIYCLFALKKYPYSVHLFPISLLDSHSAQLPSIGPLS